MVYFFVAVALASPVEEARSVAPTRVDLSWHARAIDWPGGTWVRLEPRLHGLPVDGLGAMRVDVGERGVRRVLGQAPAAAAPPVEVVQRGDAIDRAVDVGARLGEGRLWPPRAERRFLVDRGQVTPRLVWAVHLSTADPPAVWRVDVDATDGTVARTTRQSWSAEGLVYATNPLQGGLERVTLDNLDGGGALDGLFSSARSCASANVDSSLFGAADCGTWEQQAIADADGNFLYQSAPGEPLDPLAEVQVYFHVNHISSWLDERYGFLHPEPLHAYVNFQMANAFYGDFDGDGVGDLSFGHTEAGIDFGYDADVIYHEFGHSIVARNASIPSLSADAFGLEWAGGSLNEGAADIFTLVLTEDPQMAEYAGSGFGRPAIRDLEAPRRCPDDLRGEVHRDGEVLGALGWQLIADPRIGPDITADLLYGAIPQWGPDISWAAAGTSLRVAADDLMESGAITDEVHEAILAHLERSGIEGCGRVILVETHRRYDMLVMTTGLPGDLSRVPMGVQFQVDLPPDATSVFLDLDVDPTMGWSVFGRAGVPVEHETVLAAGLGIGTAVPQIFDWTVDGQGPGSVRVDVGSRPELRPGEPLFFTITSHAGDQLDLGELFGFRPVGVSFRVSTAEVGERYTPGACATGGRGAGVLGVLMALLAMRRRR